MTICDRCGKDVEDKKSGAIDGIADADLEGGGSITESVKHLCPKCYRYIWTLIRQQLKGRSR